MQVQFNQTHNQTFQSRNAQRGAKNFGDLMNRLYESAYDSNLFEGAPDIIQISAKMKDGTDVSAIANFEGGRFLGIRFPYEFFQYKSEFCKKIFEQYNQIITKGKSLKK